jgi:hypothetical protein
VDITGMSVTITPQKSDSAILILATLNTQTSSLTTGDHRGAFQITDNSNNALSGAQSGIFGDNNYSFSGQAEHGNSLSFVGYSTPATTSATTYKLRFRSLAATTTLLAVNANHTGQMYAIEVSA